ncbi:coagulation factor XII isoform X2 [Pseudophryne corroboree]|uniref:coagulation factor XII isoform X2 n=1 Tax=Pseudophryne corroboree TaxID=495146 RepID=UPI003081F057
MGVCTQKKKEEQKHKSGLVLTESGQLCHFPFHHARMVHYSCIRRGKHGPRPWCSLTKHYDEDKLWSYCVDGDKVTDHCENNPCEPRGVCESTLRSYKCICKEPYTGKDCNKDKCFDKGLQQYFEPKEKWLRYVPPKLEECTCGEKGSVCKATTGKHCSDNLCLNGGHCIQHKHSKVCGCTQGHIGPHCEINQNENCLFGNGTRYRGTVSVTATGVPCLNWESHIIKHEVSMYSGQHALGNGIGHHSYCRSPDGDPKPWCFILKAEIVSWEHCLIPLCQQITSTPASIPHPQTIKPKPPTQGPKLPVSTSKTPGDSGAHSNVTREIPLDCGKRFLKSPSISSRIVGGLVALPASHPYMAAIYIGSSFCGGSLISPCWIVTAAHCLDRRPSVKQITVVLGQSLFNTTDQHTAVFQVQKYILHEQYSENTFQNDIALVRLHNVEGTCAEYSQFVQPVCLPQITKTTGTAQHCEVAGWGHQYEGDDHYAVFLQEAHIPIIPVTQCQSPLVHGNKILRGMMCAGFMEGGVDACQGDSGGPFVCEVDGRVHLFGIVSWGSGCAEENKPGVYTDVSQYINWIIANIN